MNTTTLHTPLSTPLPRLDLTALHPRTMARHSPRYAPLGLLLAMVALLLAMAMALDTRLFQGINVWIKPLKFAVALSVYMLTLAWFARFAAPSITQRAAWRWHEQVVVLCVVAELVWIGGAAAQGVGSHFNVATPLGQTLYSLMGLAAVVLTSASTTLAWAIHRHNHSTLHPAVRAGLVWGLALTLPLTLITAGTLSSMGSHWIGGTPSDSAGLALMGWSRDGGDLRVAHFFASHAMHCIPLAALLVAWVRPTSSVGMVRVAALVYTSFVAFTFVQALLGQPFLA